MHAGHSGSSDGSAGHNSCELGPAGSHRDQGGPCPLKIVFLPPSLPHCETASEGGIFHRVKSEAVSRIKKLIWDKTHSHLFRVQRFVSIGRWRGVHREDEVQAGEEDDASHSDRDHYAQTTAGR